MADGGRSAGETADEEEEEGAAVGGAVAQEVEAGVGEREESLREVCGWCQTTRMGLDRSLTPCISRRAVSACCRVLNLTKPKRPGGKGGERRLGERG